MAEPGTIVVYLKDGSKQRIYEREFDAAVHRRNPPKAKPSQTNTET